METSHAFESAPKPTMAGLINLLFTSSTTTLHFVHYIFYNPIQCMSTTSFQWTFAYLRETLKTCLGFQNYPPEMKLLCQVVPVCTDSVLGISRIVESRAGVKSIIKKLWLPFWLRKGTHQEWSTNRNKKKVNLERNVLTIRFGIWSAPFHQTSWAHNDEDRKRVNERSYWTRISFNFGCFINDSGMPTRIYFGHTRR
jgi:hypothetical protein